MATLRPPHDTGEQQRRVLLEACPADDACSTGVSNAPPQGPPS